MNKLNVLDYTSFVAKLVVMGTFYVTVFNTSVILGIVALLAHVTHEVTERLYLLEAQKAAMVQFEEALREKTFGGNC